MWLPMIKSTFYPGKSRNVLLFFIVVCSKTTIKANAIIAVITNAIKSMYIIAVK